MLHTYVLNQADSDVDRISDRERAKDSLGKRATRCFNSAPLRNDDGKSMAAAPDKSGDGTRHPTASALVASVLSAWETRGAAVITVRGLSRMSGTQVTSVYHHFGDLENLLAAAQFEALARTRGWCATTLSALARDSLPSSGFDHLLTTLIDDWCRDQRQAALAWRECAILAKRLARFKSVFAEWQEVWIAFWNELCERFDCKSHARITACFFNGESCLHLLKSQPLIDRVVLAESCAGWTAWLQGQLAPPAPWRDIARAQAIEALALPPLEDDTLKRLAHAATIVVRKNGVAGLTHRTVAAEAGMTLGAVSHKLRTRADLFNVAFEAIYRQSVRRTENEWAASPKMRLHDVIHELASEAVGDPLHHIARDELLVACIHEPGLRSLGTQLRYLRGRNSRHYVDALLGENRCAAPGDAAVFSSFMMGLLDISSCITDKADRIASAEADLRHLAAVLSKP